MAKITFPFKSNDPNAPDSERKFRADEVNEIKRVVNHNDTHNIDFTPIVSMDKKYVTEHLMDGPINYTFDTTLEPELGNKRFDYITVNGIDEPTFEDGKFVIRYNGFLNVANKLHKISFEYVGGGKILVEIIYV